MFDFAPALWNYQSPALVGAAAGGWTPASLGSNLAYDFTNLSTSNLFTDTGATTNVTADGQTVKAIKDPTTGIILTNSTGWVYHANSGKPYLQMDGATMFVSTTTVTIGDANAQHTTYATVNLSSVSVTQSIVDMDNQLSNKRVSQLLFVQSSTSRSIAFNSSGTAFTATGPSVSASANHVLSEVTQTANVQAFADGTGGTATTVTGTLDAQYGTLNLGGRNPGGTANQFATGQFFGAFGVKGLLSGPDSTSAETYMAAL